MCYSDKSWATTTGSDGCFAPRLVGVDFKGNSNSEFQTRGIGILHEFWIFKPHGIRVVHEFQFSNLTVSGSSEFKQKTPPYFSFIAWIPEITPNFQKSIFRWVLYKIDCERLTFINTRGWIRLWQAWRSKLTPGVVSTHSSPRCFVWSEHEILQGP